MKDLPKGFDCKTCGKFHRFDPYVFAHSRDLLVHTCDNCGAKHEIIMFHATQKKKGKLPKVKA